MLAMPENCCSASQPITRPSPLSCFTSSDSPSQKRCLDPITLFTTDDMQANRCASNVDCSGGFSCTRPLPSENLLRLTIRPSPWNLNESKSTEGIIVWKGPRKEVWEEGLHTLSIGCADIESSLLCLVVVGKLFPRFKRLPLWLPSTAQLVFQCVNGEI